MLKFFFIYVYTLLYTGATLYFVTTLINKKFDTLLNTLNELFMVSNPVGGSTVSKRVYRDFPIMFPNRVTYVKQVELVMFVFDVILGMVWLHAFFSFIDCRTMVLKFNLQNEPALELNGGKSSLEVETYLV